PRASPLPPGNWCDAWSTVCASAATENAQQVAAAASAAANFLIGLLLILGTFLSLQGTQFCEHCQSLPRRRARNDCDRAATNPSQALLLTRHRRPRNCLPSPPPPLTPARESRP